MTTEPVRHKTGVLLINTGTPDAPESGAVRRYLRQFLSDPRVLDINPIGRFFLLEGAILPFRPSKSAEAYRKVWTPEGSPLRVHCEALRAALQQRLGPAVPVELGMQYGSPSIPGALEKLHQQAVEHVVVAPLFPQYASSSTGSSLETVFRHAVARWTVPSLSTVPPFYDDPGFLDAFVEVARPVLEMFSADFVLFSFHGLPERHMHKSDDSGKHCLASDDCCATIGTVNRNCYRAHCFATARGLAERLQLEKERQAVSFQSRLGRTPWIKPYTDELLPELAKKGVRRLAVFCPAFVADCLETLEEIGIRARESFKQSGGEELVLIPSLNAHPRWVEALATLVSASLPKSSWRRNRNE
jgi:ferrochelatase